MGLLYSVGKPERITDRRDAFVVSVNALDPDTGHQFQGRFSIALSQTETPEQAIQHTCFQIHHKLAAIHKREQEIAALVAGEGLTWDAASARLEDEEFAKWGHLYEAEESPG